MKGQNSTVGILLKACFSFGLFAFCFLNTSAQQKLAPEIYLIRFTNKSNSTYSLDRPQEFLSSRAISRRNTRHIIFENNDLPVNEAYIDSLKKAGFNVINVSKWINAVSVKVEDTVLFRKLNDFSFVKPYLQTALFRNTEKKTSKYLENAESKLKSSELNYGASLKQLSVHQGDYLHKKGFEGQGMLIAVLDAGFQNVKDFTSLQNLWFEHRVLSTHDFADKTGNTFYGSLHGSNVLSVMAGNSDGNLIGSAPKASYILIHSENNSINNFETYEYPVEEFDWVVAAEYADSLGADIINSSLGYSRFLDPSLNYTYEQMNGETAISSKGAEIASSKGILVVCSAGNEGDNDWKYITAPADAKNILTVGAVDLNGMHASFSSVGPTADKRIKPDVVAIGKGTFLQSSTNVFSRSSGTSFAAPVISGLAACLWQAVPNATNIQIIDAIKSSSSLASNPDTLYGYGIPNFKKALYMLNPSIFPEKNQLSVYPNPFNTTFTLEFVSLANENVTVQIFDMVGRIVYEDRMMTSSSYPTDISINTLSKIPKGMYIIRLLTGASKLQTRILKL